MTKTRGRPKAFDENAVLALAMEYFWEHGYENSSLDNLLEVMGIKKSSFYHTFKSKEELFSRCLALYTEQNIHFLNQVKEEKGAVEALLSLAQLTIEQLNKTKKVRGCLIINSGKECYNKYKELSHQINAGFNSIHQTFISFVKEAQESGEIGSKLEAQKIAGRYMNALNGLIVTIQAGATQELIDDLMEHLQEILA